ncbi:EamA family transporter RarD [Desulfosarcina ovata]|uniref:Chloramphenicol resistance permease RarD n=1 Tax=Desulfosarcina ovata subsp. ovata TaxID=2752305 RepID=A0A5K8A598_9BACT|nr:EamA family transporter RarD [Desulfosarcina ovata]BBO87742.1 chloramphenicol resistance permease RarD [Desulfosarcina ovata subsp. ovata]
MTNTPSSAAPDHQPAVGTLLAFTAFLIWGLSPVYWKALHAVGAFEIILHRVLWSFVVLMPLVGIGRQWHAFTRAIRSPRTLVILLVTSILVGTNWLLYIWSVNNGRVLQASLGYYINPLVNVFLGTLFLRERLRRAQTVAVILAGLGVLHLTVRYGEFPWVSLTLAFTFGFYGLVRKVAAVGALVGLTIETLLLAIPAAIWVLYLHRTGGGAFLHAGLHTDLLLMGTGILTATPLLLFNLGAKRITLSTLGFIQYMAPTGMLILGITLFGEPFTPVQAITFGLIWTALAIYSWDALRVHRSRHRLR